MNPWIAGARPKTLPAAVVPVAVGLSVAAGEDAVRWWLGVPALVVSLALQVGVNYANDYSDGIRGTDDVRVGPLRLVGSGLVAPHKVKWAAFAAFGVAAVAGLIIAFATSLWLLVVGVAAIAAGWFYTGGKNPYGYLGLGEVFVFTFFGLVATVGSTFAVSERMPSLAWLASVPVGCLACALLVVNNLRDIPTDSSSGKKTLAVRLGDRRTRGFYALLCFLAVVFTVCAGIQRPAAVFGLIGLAAVLQPLGSVRSGVTGRDLIAVLAATGRAQMLFGVSLSFGLLIGA